MPPRSSSSPTARRRKPAPCGGNGLRASLWTKGGPGRSVHQQDALRTRADVVDRAVLDRRRREGVAVEEDHLYRDHAVVVGDETVAHRRRVALDRRGGLVGDETRPEVD